MNKDTSDFKKTSIEATFRLLETSKKGLTKSEAKKRITNYGYNEIKEEKRHPLVEFFSRYWGPMPWLLEIAIILSYFLGHYLETAIIFVLLSVNVVIGFIHARHSEKVLDFLKKWLAINAKVLRDGAWILKDAKEIVPGDIIGMELGDLIPADAKIISGELSVDQSALTGESRPVSVRTSDIVYSSTLVTAGEATCVIVNTGTSTSFGRTAELLKVAKPKSHQEKVILTIIKYMLFVGIATLIVISLFALFTGIGYVALLTFVVIFLMAAIPVALPAVITIVQSVGAMELAKENVLVTRLDSIEDAASIDVLCLDKTGTITQNKLSVTDIIPFRGYTKEDMARIARLASLKSSKEMIDQAIINNTESQGLDVTSYKKIQFIPFDPSIKRAEAIIERENRQFKVMKGSPQVILGLCKTISKKERKIIDHTIEDLSKKGYRTLAIAKSADNDFDYLQFLGLIALADPLRPDSKGMIEAVRKLGIKPLMLTGDNISIAREIARQASIGGNIIHINKLKDLSEEEKLKICKTYDGFAEIYPEDKYIIVTLLQSCGHLVGMTGDGVNDAPALKQAEMGIAVSNSTDVAKGAASVVLEEPGLGVIADAIRISRKTYQRMLTWVINKITKTIVFIGILAIGFFWLHNLIITLLGMALLLVANDFVTISLATDNERDTSTPDTWNVRNITLASLIMAILLVIQTTTILFIGREYLQMTFDELITFVTLTLIFNSLLGVLIIRERKHFWSSRPGKELIISVFITLVAFLFIGVFGFIVTPILLYQILFALGFSTFFIFVIVDPIKYWTFKKFCL
jgi:H+-transporting ATPase